MGGGAFKQATAPGNPTLNTPRMSPAEYMLLRDTYLYKIRAYISDPHAKVTTLKEAPEKLTYGDIDLFIGLDKEIDFTDLANAVGATGLICRGPQKCSLGVRKDGASSSQPTIEYQLIHTKGNSSPDSTQVTPEEYAQIDINVVPTDLVDWHMFYSAYGDLNGLLGHIVTHLGFTVTDQGLWLRMKELDAAKTIERANIADNLGKIFLSNEPQEVMRFLGLSVEDSDAGFATLDQLYEWLCACRMIHSVTIKLRRYKAHDRNREQNRDVYRRFFFEWLPERMPDMATSYDKEERSVEIAQLRQKYLDEALDFFDKRPIYEKMHRSAVATVNDAIASNLLRPIIIKHSGAPAKKLGELVRAFRRFVRFDDDGQPYLGLTARTDSESQLPKFLDDDAVRLKDEVAVDEFVRVNWQKAKELERSRAKRTAEKNEVDGRVEL